MPLVGAGGQSFLGAPTLAALGRCLIWKQGDWWQERALPLRWVSVPRRWDARMVSPSLPAWVIPFI